MLQQFKLENLTNLDSGRVVEAWNQALKALAMDCDDRPGQRDKRTLSLVLEAVPIVDEDGQLDSIAAQFQVVSKYPARKSKEYSFGFRQGGQLVFNDMSEDNVHQKTIDEIDGE